MRCNASRVCSHQSMFSIRSSISENMTLTGMARNHVNRIWRYILRMHRVAFIARISMYARTCVEITVIFPAAIFHKHQRNNTAMLMLSETHIHGWS